MKNIYRGLGALALCIALGIFVSYNSYIDKLVAGFFDSIRTPIGVEVMRSITTFGETSVLTPIIILSLLYFLFKKHWEFGVIFALGVALNGYMTGYLKDAFGVIRPTPFYGAASGYSYPSGHTSHAAIVFLILILYFLSLKHAVVKRVGVTVCSLAILGVGISRMYLNVHWFTDVIGGFLLALSITLILNGCVDVLEKKKA